VTIAVRALSETDPDLSAFGIDRSRVVVGHIELAPSERQVFIEGARTVPREVHVRRLRSRLADASPDWRYIHTHFGHGYRVKPEPVDERK
jgi:hypothetical protein